MNTKVNPFSVFAIFLVLGLGLLVGYRTGQATQDTYEAQRSCVRLQGVWVCNHGTGDRPD